MMAMPTSGPAHSAMTELSTDTRDRVISLECDLAHAVRTIDGINAKVTTMHEPHAAGRRRREGEPVDRARHDGRHRVRGLAMRRVGSPAAIACLPRGRV